MFESDITVVVGCLEPLLRCGLVQVLGADPRVRVLASDLEGVELERVVVRELPRVVILGEAFEYALLARLRSRRTACAVLVLAQEQPLLWSALQAVGVRCLARSAAEADILAVVHGLARGERVSVDGGDSRVAKRQPPQLRSLTRRQAQVFRHLSEDTPYAAIALEMNLTVATVRTHARAVFRKLGVLNRHELVGRSMGDGSLSDRV